MWSLLEYCSSVCGAAQWARGDGSEVKCGVIHSALQYVVCMVRGASKVGKIH